MVAGDTMSFGAGESDFWVLKLDANGSIIWQKAYGGSGDEVAHFIIQTSTNGEYMVAGWTESFGTGKRDAWILKLDSNGSVIWQKAYGGSGYDIASSIIQSIDSGYVVAGYIDLEAKEYDAWLLKLDASGYILFRPTSDINTTNTDAKTINSNAITSNTNIIPIDSNAITSNTTITSTNIDANITSQAP